MLVVIVIAAAPLNAGPTGNAEACSATSTAPPARPSSFYYLRLGTGALFVHRTYNVPSLGFGFRGMLGSIAIDTSMNLLAGGSGSGSDEPAGLVAGSLFNMRVLRFVRPDANGSTYFGGGMSWGGVAVKPSRDPYVSIHGTGLQAETTVGYEFARRKARRLFAEVDAVLPLYEAGEAMVYNSSPFPTVVRGQRYVPSVTLSFGVGW